MTTASTSSIRRAQYEAHNDAISADNAYQAELDAQKIERYTVAAEGAEGSRLRELYEAKLAADAHRKELTDLLRRCRGA